MHRIIIGSDDERATSLDPLHLQTFQAGKQFIGAVGLVRREGAESQFPALVGSRCRHEGRPGMGRVSVMSGLPHSAPSSPVRCPDVLLGLDDLQALQQVDRLGQLVVVLAADLERRFGFFVFCLGLCILLVTLLGFALRL